MPAQDEVAAPRVGRIVYLHRKRQGMTQRELGEKVGVDSSYISRIERGLVDTPQRPLLERLAAALGIRASEFYLSELERHPPGADALDLIVARLRGDASAMADIRDAGPAINENTVAIAADLLKVYLRGLRG